MKVLNNNNSEVLNKLVNFFVTSLMEKLQPVLKDSCSIGKLDTGTWENPQIIWGYVEFSPHKNPVEENIDATLSFDIRESFVKMSADICWSDGEVISDFGDYQIEYSSLIDLSEKIQIVYSQIESKMVQKMVEFIRAS